MARSAPWLLALVMLLGVSPVDAADMGRLGPPPAPAIVEELPPAPGAVPLARTGPLMPPPQVRYGCQRVWRCDTTVCEWRRGCWGVYGYVEGPYYTPAFARRQAESHGLLYPRERRRRLFTK